MMNSWADNVVKDSEGLIKERRSVFQERAEPSPLSSSLYYGGQEDMYVKTSNAQTSGSYPLVSLIFRRNLISV